MQEREEEETQLQQKGGIDYASFSCWRPRFQQGIEKFTTEKELRQTPFVPICYDNTYGSLCLI